MKNSNQSNLVVSNEIIDDITPIFLDAHGGTEDLLRIIELSQQRSKDDILIINFTTETHSTCR